MKNKYEIRGDVTAIFLKYKGKTLETLIDTGDLDVVKTFPGTWIADYRPKQNTFYAYAKFSNKTLYLHRLLMGNPKGELIDHIDGNPLNNRKSTNLRITNKSGNGQNQRKLRSDNKSGVRGVYWCKKDKAWLAKFSVKGKIYYLGAFPNVPSADKAIKEARAKYMPLSPEAENRKVLN